MVNFNFTLRVEDDSVTTAITNGIDKFFLKSRLSEFLCIRHV